MHAASAMTEGPLSQQPLSEGAYQAARCCWACLPTQIQPDLHP